MNFAAAKLVVEGNVDPRLVQRAAARERIVATPAGAEPPVAARAWRRNPHLAPTAASGLLLVLAWVGDLVWFGPAAGGAAQPLALGLYLVAAAAGGWHTYWKGLRSLVRMRFDMNTLMTLAVTGAVLIGEWREGAVVAFLYGVSETLEAWSMDRARRAIGSLVSIQPRVARIRRGDGEAVEVPVAAVQVGEIMLVRPGEKIALDGAVVTGLSAVNQAAITGESAPVPKAPGDEVFAGTLNGDGALAVAVTRRADDTTLARIIHLVEEAQTQRAPAQRFIDRFARYYTPAVLALAVAVAVVPPLWLGLSWHESLYRGLALLVVGCPCALVVSTPVALLSAIGNAARGGVLVKGGAYLEAIGRVRAVAFDKTGTLTRGEPAVTDIYPLDDESAREQVLAQAAAVERESEHPLADAVRRAAAAAGIAVPPADNFQAYPGRGGAATVQGEQVYAGSPQLFRSLGAARGDLAAVVTGRLLAAGKTVIWVGSAAAVRGVIAVQDQPRPHAAEALAALKAAGVAETVMLTGDNPATAYGLARQLGLDTFHAGLLPADKVAVVQELRQRHGTIAMVGDGVNDAPALAAANIGIAMGAGGTDVALETADVVLMVNDLTRLPFLVRLGRATLAVIRQNIALALGLKLLALLAIVPGWLTLWLAIVGDMGATLLVTANGTRLFRIKPRP